MCACPIDLVSRPPRKITDEEAAATLSFLEIRIILGGGRWKKRRG